MRHRHGRHQGNPANDIAAKLWDNQKILVTGIAVGEPQSLEYSGIRVTPNVYTTVDEVDVFIEAMTKLAKS